MGQVNFNTDIDKNVDITKTVFLDVDKFVDADVDIDGRLATAEASADAIGAAGTGTGDPITFFLIDDFQSSLLVQADAVPPPGFGSPANGSVDLDPGESDFPDGTDRDVTVTIGSGDGTSVFESGAGGGVADFSNPAGTAAEFDVVYNLPVITNVLNGANEATAFVHISMAGSDLGETLDLIFEDADGTESQVQVQIPAGSSGAPVTVSVPLSDFANPANFTDPGGDNDLNFEQIVRFELIIEEATEADTFLDIVEIKDFAPGGGTLAETDTFAQVDETGAFAFSESLAAFDPGDDFTIA
ncbi:MAG TPA: hypothetical protein EYH07_01020 [Kiloniellaceae bacterium]|nr:hypothetical protein [Kiloniellaceae bacterium]